MEPEEPVEQKSVEVAEVDSSVEEVKGLSEPEIED